MVSAVGRRIFDFIVIGVFPSAGTHRRRGDYFHRCPDYRDGILAGDFAGNRMLPDFLEEDPGRGTLSGDSEKESSGLVQLFLQPVCESGGHSSGGGRGSGRVGKYAAGASDGCEFVYHFFIAIYLLHAFCAQRKSI